MVQKGSGEKIVINAAKLLRGAPPVIDSPDDLLNEAVIFFDSCEKEGQRPTITGLALALGYSGREGLKKAEKARGGLLGDAIKRAKSVIEMWRESQLGSGRDIGHMFILENMGWSRRQRIELGDDDDVRGMDLSNKSDSELHEYAKNSRGV